MPLRTEEAGIERHGLRFRGVKPSKINDYERVIKSFRDTGLVLEAESVRVVFRPFPLHALHNC